MEVSKIRGPLFGNPLNKTHEPLGSILGPPALGNSNIAAELPTSNIP